MKMSKKNDINRQGFSLRRLILQGTQVTVSNRQSSKSSDNEDGKSKKFCEKQKFDEPQNSSYETRKFKSAHNVSLTNMQKHDKRNVCPICYNYESYENSFFQLEICKHSFCKTCMVKYLKNEINESRTDIACAQCSMAIHPNNIEELLKDCTEFIFKYEDFMVRRYLVTDPDSRWCPAPDCSFAVIASSCASCPQIKCMRPGCGLNFCYHCKAEWHPDQTCDAARTSRHMIRTSSLSFSSESHRDEIKPCPRCQVLIVKMNDGSCNHMVCSVCGAEFCWLCMKEVSDLHYLSPSGCTFWGKKPWSRKKKIFWQLGTLIGAPVGIALLAGIAIPSIVIGIPVWVGRKLLERHKSTTKQKRNLSVIVGVTASILISPALAGLTIAIGVPILLFYVYGVVPVSLCRSSCSSSENDNFKLCTDEENSIHVRRDGLSVSAVSKIDETGIGDVTISVPSESKADMQNGLAALTIQGPCRISTGNVNGKNTDFQMDEISTGSFSGKSTKSEKYVTNSNYSTSGLAGSLKSYKNDGSDKCSINSAGTLLGSERAANKDSGSTKQSNRNIDITNTASYRMFSSEIQNNTINISECSAECTDLDIKYDP